MIIFYQRFHVTIKIKIKNKHMNKLYLTLLFGILMLPLSAQFGYGLTATNDLYHRIVNPKDASGLSPSAGSAILNLGAGPKIWFGNPKFSFSLEAQANIGFLTVSSKENKGLGSAYFPIMGKLNFGGISSFDKELKMGFSIGGGVQFSRTELYGVRDNYIDQGVSRKLFMTPIIQAGYGVGISGFTTVGFVRYGWDVNQSANVLHIGLQYDFNRPMLKKISSAESSL